MRLLSRPLGELRAHYDVIVVGSGYGGAITAARLAAARKPTKEGGTAPVQVAVLERGEEILPGDFPRTLAAAAGRTQLHVRGKRYGSTSGLYDLRIDRDLSVVVGSGLGGTSLINANVVLEPDKQVRKAKDWPEELDFANPGWDRYFDRVRDWLGATPYPEPTGQSGDGTVKDPGVWPRLPKLISLDRAGSVLQAGPGDWKDGPGKGSDGPQGHPPLGIETPHLAVTFQPGINRYGGVRQNACTLCGDCVAGCNYRAKNTLPMNYLAAAAGRGAQIFCGVSVRNVERADEEKWLVRIEPVDSHRDAYDAPPMFVTAGVVVLAAGSLGSTEILLRSNTLSLSRRLGERFSGNADVIAFGYNFPDEVRGVGAGARPPELVPLPGPTITGLIDLRDEEELEDQLIIEEGTIPGALAMPTRVLMAVFAGLYGVYPRAGSPWSRVRAWFRVLGGLVLGVRRGALRNTQTYLVNGHDAVDPRTGLGRLLLHEGRLRVHWPGVGDMQVFKAIDALLRRATLTLQGVHLINPMWSTRGRRRLLTVHPLGGCPMGDSADEGVVDHRGAVFDPGTSNDSPVHEGLYVSDGAVIPRSLGANPLLTISAIAERNAERLIESRKWSSPETARGSVERSEEGSDRGAEASTEPGQRIPRPGIRFTERLAGWLQPTDSAAFDLAGGRVEAILTIEADDYWELCRDGSYECRVYGTVFWPCQFKGQPLTAVGTFQLFAPDPERVETLRMRYELDLRATDGTRCWLSGHKTIHDDPELLDIWPDISALTFVLKPDDQSDDVIARGRLRLAARDVWRLVRSVRVLRPQLPRQRVTVLLRFALLYLRTVVRQFGRMLRPSDVADPYSPYDRVPPLRASAAIGGDVTELDPTPGRGRDEIRLLRCEEGTVWVRTADGAVVTLTRHHEEGGRKGPVLLAPGFGTSTIAFTISTNDVLRDAEGKRQYPADPVRFLAEGGTQEGRSFTDFLTARGYDVWLFDYRASELSSASGTQFTLDDIAAYDWPAAVEAVLRIRRAEDTHRGEEPTQSVQILGHCVGSLSLLMSVLGGHLDDGVRSIVCSQSLTHIDQPNTNRIKATLRLATLLHKLGGWPTYNPDYDVRSGMMSRLIDYLLRLLPWERCRNPVCRRIQFLYGSVNRHEQLNAMTHDAMHEMFNEANKTTFEHLSRMIRKRRIVDAEGRDRYVTPAGAARMRLPVGLLQGEANPIFRPRGLDWSHRWLVREAAEHAPPLPDGLTWAAPEDQPERGLFRKVLLRGPEPSLEGVSRDRYGHMDCFIGRSCWNETFETILDELERGDRVAQLLADGSKQRPRTIPSSLTSSKETP